MIEKNRFLERICNVFALQWKPSWEIGFVLLSWLLVIGGLWMAFKIFTIQNVALNFITFGPITLFGLGVVVPSLWIIKKGLSPKALGITMNKALTSIVLSIVFSVIQYSQTLANITLPSAEKFVPLVTMALSVGLFEAIFFRGWVQLRFEKAFGILPGIVLGSAIYALYHIGYGMEPNEIAILFIIGLIYASVFRLTKNLFIIWPFLTPMGGLFNNIKEGLTLPFEATYGFVLVLGLMVCFTIFFIIYSKGKRRNSDE